MKHKTKLDRCTSRVRGEFKWKGKILGEYEFLADHIAAYVENRSEPDGYGSIANIDEIYAWVTNADLENPTACAMPTEWEKFELLAAEMLGVGIGYCYCTTCRRHYEGFELASGSGWGSAGWLAVNLQCPNSHEIMKFDLLMPFCGHKARSDGIQAVDYEIPAFLMKSPIGRRTK